MSTVQVDYEGLAQVCRGMPFVQVFNELPPHVPSVVIDQRLGSRLATQHLIDLGHTAICEISGPASWFGAQVRHDSWANTMDEAGLTPGASVRGDWSAKSGYEAACRLIDEGNTFTALVVGNDQMALGAIYALNERQLHVPEKVSVVGFDDIPEAAYFLPPLTTVRQDFAALGDQSVEYLVSFIENPDIPIHQRVLYPELIVRQSAIQRT
jgi:LacI family transcriptional regulator